MPIDKNKRTLITFAVDKDIKEKLIILANKQNRSLSNFLLAEVEKIIENSCFDNFPPDNSHTPIENP